jgi:predicted class III extradiol MEMO1 family dioxygenase
MCILTFGKAINQSSLKHAIKFVYYAQSSQCTAKTDSSVSYAVAVTTKVGKE